MRGGILRHCNAMVLEAAPEPANRRVRGQIGAAMDSPLPLRKLARTLRSMVLGEAEKRNINNCLELQEIGPVENRQRWG